MKKDNIEQLTWDFESFVNKLETWLEFWFARDLQKLLGYWKWDNFLNVISKAKIAVEISWEDSADHFADVGKMVQLWSWSEREINDIMLTRYSCYIIAMNGDSSKIEIAFAQQYFAVQTRKVELIEKRLLESERVTAREKLKETEKELSQVIFEQTKWELNFSLIRSKWYNALFQHTTKEMKKRWGINLSKPLADFMPTILLKAKDFATEITIHNAKEKNMQTEKEISSEHITNNETIRKTLIERWITPEKLLPEEDLEKVKRRLTSEPKKALKWQINFKK